MNENRIDLGVNRKEAYGEPAMAMSQGPPSGDKVYPSFTYSGPEELDLPDEGEMTVCFHKVSETRSVRADGKHWYDCQIEVKCLCEVEGGDEDEDEDEDEKDEITPPTRRDTSAEDALDALAKAVSERKSNGER